MKLYQISESYQNIADLLLTPEFAENEAVQNALDQIQEDFDKKVGNVVKAMKNLEAEIDPIDAEIKRLTAMKRTRQNSIEWLKNYLKQHFKATQTAKVKCDLFSVSYRETEGGAVELDEKAFLDNNLNEELITVKITPNKTAIKTALNNGESIVGAKLVNSQVLTIR